MKSSVEPRIVGQLSESLNRHLSQYALAASAAGMGMLALALPAECKIVYTPAHKNAITGINLDLNHDGAVDFRLCHSSNSIHCTATSGAPHPLGFYSRLVAKPKNKSNGVVGKGRFASALVAGKAIGGKGAFPKGDSIMAYGSASATSRSGGPWLNVNDRYLGFKFVIKGKIHYGWARLNVYWKGPKKAILTGYAYETIPNKPIITGKTKGPDVITLEPGSLGTLAAGVSRLCSGK